MADSSKVHSVLALPPSTNKVKSQPWFDYKIPSTLENYIELVVKLIQYCCCNPCHHSLPYCAHFHCAITFILGSSWSSCNDPHLVKRIVRMLPALLLLLPVALAIDCPEGWMGIHGSCYLVSRTPFLWLILGTIDGVLILDQNYKFIIWLGQCNDQEVDNVYDFFDSRQPQTSQCSSTPKNTAGSKVIILNEKGKKYSGQIILNEKGKKYSGQTMKHLRQVFANYD